MQTIKDKVEKLLRDIPKCRNSDLELYIEYFKQYHCSTFVEMQVIEKLFKAMGGNIAGITRVRADLQNKEGKYLSDIQTQKIRDEREGDMTEHFSDINNGLRY